jgi:hypothetical protein
LRGRPATPPSTLEPRTYQAVWKRGAPVIRGLFFVSGGRSLDADCPENVIGEDREGHLGCGSFEVPGQESCARHHPLDGTKRILSGAAPSRHQFGSASGIHASERTLVQVAFEETALGRSALRFESAAGAIGRHIRAPMALSFRCRSLAMTR